MEDFEQYVTALQEQIRRIKQSRMLHGISQGGESGILRIIGRYTHHYGKAPTALKISQAMGITQATITPMIDRLVKKGLVERTVSPTDRRAKLLTLTPEGETLLHQTLQQERSHFMALLAHLGLEDSEHLIRISEKMYRFLEEENRS